MGGGFGEGFKVRLGKNLVSKARDEDNGIDYLGPDDPYDPCVNNDAGHGTHVAGIIAGYDKERNFVGIAPNVNLGIYRIFGCEGGAGEDTVIKAMEMAYEAGCKIINLSLGIENDWPEDAMSAVADNISNKGVIVVGVAGNQGGAGVFSQNAPASGKNVMSVASIDNSFYPANVLNLDIIPDKNFPYMFSSNTVSFPNGTLAHVLNNGDAPFGCKDDTNIESSKVDEKILFLRRGQCTFNEKLKKAEDAGAIGIVFYDPDPNVTSLVVAKNENGTLPLVSIDHKLAVQIIEHLKAETDDKAQIKLTFPEVKEIVYPETAGKMSEFSSVGPSYELDLKPSITGIGGDVYSTIPMHINEGWGVRSGTSMASPHIAGVAALMIGYYSKENINVTSTFIVEHLQNHAKIITSKSGIPENPIVQGAGLIKPLDTIESKIHVSPSQISFNDTESDLDYKTHTINIQNLDSFPLFVSLKNIHSNSVELYANDTSFVPTEPAITNGTVKVELEFAPAQQSIVLPPNSVTAVQVKVVLPDPNELFYHYQMYGGFISLMSIETGESLATIPYFGVLGKMKEIPLFDKDFPYLAPYSDTDRRVKSGAEFRFDLGRKAKTKPAIVLRLLTGSANMEIKVHDVNHKYVGAMSGGPWIYNQRNTLSEDGYSSSIAWSGKVIPNEDEHANVDYDEPDKAVQVEDGTYFIHVRALKHFGSPENDDDWEEWKSGPIIVSS